MQSIHTCINYGACYTIDDDNSELAVSLFGSSLMLRFVVVRGLGDQRVNVVPMSSSSLLLSSPPVPTGGTVASSTCLRSLVLVARKE